MLKEHQVMIFISPETKEGLKILAKNDRRCVKDYISLVLEKFVNKELNSKRQNDSEKDHV